MTLYDDESIASANRTTVAVEFTVDELIERLQEIKDTHKKVFVETDMEATLVPVIGVEEKHYGIIIVT